jgi:polysaccharide export outer membrane protein
MGAVTSRAEEIEADWSATMQFLRATKRINGAKLGAVLALTLIVTSLAAQANDGKSSVDKAADASRVGSQPIVEGSDYVIGADDVLKIAIWKETDLSTTVPVRPDGKISVALIGDIVAAGYTPMQLGDVITEKLKTYISDPRVTVVVTAINSRKVFILGEVQHTGSYSLLPHMTVLQALSSAGGFSQFANLKGIYVLRNDKGKQSKLRFNYKQAIKGGNVKQNVELHPGDTIVVP